MRAAKLEARLKGKYQSLNASDEDLCNVREDMVGVVEATFIVEPT